MESKHTKGEWTFKETSSKYANGIKTVLSYTISHANDTGFYRKSIAVINPKSNDDLNNVHYSQEEALANAERIVHCVNSHDELVNALNKLIKTATKTTANVIGFDGADELDNAIDYAKNILIKAEKI